MPDTEDMELVREYAASGSDEAFAEIVSRHINMVFSVALRQVNNPQEAEEITQAVFIILSRKARALGRGTILSGWLFRTTRFTAANYLRTEIRRKRREQETSMQSELTDTSQEPIDQEMFRRMAPVLDEAIASLGEADRNALVLRFVEGRTLSEVGVAMGGSEDGARMRLKRAVDRLRKFFLKRGVTLSVAGVASVLSAYSVQAAPASLSTTVTTAVAVNSTATVASAALAKATLKWMAWMKIKTAAAASLGIALAAGTVVVAVEELHGQPETGGVPQTVSASAPTVAQVATTNDTDPRIIWELDTKVLASEPKVATVRRSPVPKPPTAKKGGLNMQTATGMRMIETGQPLTSAVAYAYGLDETLRIRTILPPDERQSEFDYLDAVPGSGKKTLQKELREKFGFTVRRETRMVNVFWLRVKTKGPNLTAVPAQRGMGGGAVRNLTGFYGGPAPMAFIAAQMEAVLMIPVVDQTRAAGLYNYKVKYDTGASVEEIKKAVLDQLGLELVASPTPQSVQFVIVEKAESKKE